MYDDYIKDTMRSKNMFFLQIYWIVEFSNLLNQKNYIEFCNPSQPRKSNPILRVHKIQASLEEKKKSQKNHQNPLESAQKKATKDMSETVMRWSSEVKEFEIITRNINSNIHGRPTKRVYTSCVLTRVRASKRTTSSSRGRRSKRERKKKNILKQSGQSFQGIVSK